uniref:SBP-type domain-containing protein n=1 Tax=Chenopodium quinoa TaxID=63459 RepID=A0A803N9B7_CHEQI
MEEVGTQVASPLYIHQNIGGRFCEGALIGAKRSLCYNSGSNHHQQQQQHSQIHRSGHGWNPKDWEWDSSHFLARSRPLESDRLRLGSLHEVSTPNNKEVVNPVLSSSFTSKSSSPPHDDQQGGNSLRLQLGGVGDNNGTGTSFNKTSVGNVQSSNSTEEPVSSLRPNKKVRSGSPGGGNYPMCQVDSCSEDLSKSKDYHRRHKVCELHSKATKALVGKQMQRFCQQCSRFHPLAEFDEGKRSCRRRLAGHNKRRRKTQAEDTTSPAIQPTDSHKTGYGNLDIVNLLTVLARGQGALGQSNMDVDAASRSTTNLLAVLSATLAASSPGSLAFFSQKSNPGSCVDKNKSTTMDKDTGSDACKKPSIELQSLGGERSSSSYQSPTEDSDSQVQDTRTNLPLQLFSSSPGDDSSPNLVTSRRYFSSDSSNPTEERSHSSAAPVTRKLFPLETASESARPVRMSFSEEANVNVEASRTETSASRMTLELFTMGNKAASNSLQNLPHQAGYTSSSGSDHSPPSFNSDPQKDRTGRIIFKLFDKDPSQLPGALRTQIYNWLSNSPSDMESYIRPGCVVLSIYVSMSSAAWEQLEESFLQRVEALVQDSDFEFWRSGRFSVNIGTQLAVHKDDPFRFVTLWTEGFAFANLGAQNLTSPGTKIHCAYMGGYSSKEVLKSSDQGLPCEEIRLNEFNVHAAASSVLGRCFIEVENGVRGNCFPIIIADAKICQELRLLEREFYEAKDSDVITDDQANMLQYLLTFSTERDYSALVKTLLDIFVEAESRMDGLSTECVEALSNMHLLHRAVKRSSRKMVDMLVHYSAPCSYDIVDALTNDPMQIGPHSWRSLLDDGEVRQRPSLPLDTKQKSCSKCAMRSYSRMPGSHGFLHRPFIHSMLTIAAVCVCVCLFFKSLHVNSVTPFMWDNVDFGAM